MSPTIDDWTCGPPLDPLFLLDEPELNFNLMDVCNDSDGDHSSIGTESELDYFSSSPYIRSDGSTPLLSSASQSPFTEPEDKKFDRDTIFDDFPGFESVQPSSIWNLNANSEVEFKPLVSQFDPIRPSTSAPSSPLRHEPSSIFQIGAPLSSLSAPNLEEFPKPKRRYNTAKRRREAALAAGIPFDDVPVDRALNATKKTAQNSTTRRRKTPKEKEIEKVLKQIRMEHDYSSLQTSRAPARRQNTEMKKSDFINPFATMDLLTNDFMGCDLMEEDASRTRGKKRSPAKRADMDDEKRSAHNGTERDRRAELTRHIRGLMMLINKKYFKKATNNPSKYQVLIAAQACLKELIDEYKAHYGAFDIFDPFLLADTNLLKITYYSAVHFTLDRTGKPAKRRK